MSKGKLTGWFRFIGAFVLLATAGWNAFRIVEPALRWNTTRATAEGTRVAYKHDGEAFLVFYISTRLTYDAAGQRVVTEAASDFATNDYSKIRALAGRLERRRRFRCIGIRRTRNRRGFLLRTETYSTPMLRG